MLTTWDAVSTLDRMLDDVMGSALGTATNTRSFAPDIDVRTNDNEALVICDVPGVKREDIDITVENHVLTIKGTRKFDSRENEQVMLGRTYGAFKRAFTLPDDLDDSNLDAHLADGVLTIRIAKHAQAKPRKIQVGTGSNSKQLKE
jgi:HSP20 family protein